MWSSIANACLFYLFFTNNTADSMDVSWLNYCLFIKKEVGMRHMFLLKKKLGYHMYISPCVKRDGSAFVMKPANGIYEFRSNRISERRTSFKRGSDTCAPTVSVGRKLVNDATRGAPTLPARMYQNGRQGVTSQPVDVPFSGCTCYRPRCFWAIVNSQFEWDSVRWLQLRYLFVLQ